MEMTRAIVLRNEYPERLRMLLFDENRGIVSCWSDRMDLAVGSLIDYSCAESGTGYSAQAINVHALPCCGQLSDLLFFHQVVEICVQFIPEGSEAKDLFALLLFLYDQKRFISLQNDFLKKVFLCKIFIILGIWPAGKKFQNSFFYRIASESIDNLLGLSIELKDECVLNDWLQMCIAMHPHARDFKTWQFVSREIKQ